MAPAVTVARCGYAKGCPSYQRSWAHRVRRLVLSGLAAASYAYCTEPAAFARPSGSPAAPELNVVPAPLGCVAMLPARGAGGHRVPCPRDRSARCSQGCSTCWMPTSASSMAEHPECPVRPGGLFLSHELDVDPLRLLLSDPARPCRRSRASQIPCRLESLTAGLGARSDELPAGNFFVQLGAVQWARCERLRAGS